MKKSFMLLLCAGSVITASAQKGSVLLFGNFGGAAAINNDVSSTMKYSNFGITPGLGYQLSDRWTLGVEGTFNYSRAHATGIQYESARQVIAGGGLFARYTVPINNLLFFYTQGEALYSVSKNFNNGFESAGGNNLNLRISPHIGINIKNGYALNIGFGSVGYNLQRFSGISTSTFTYNFSQGFSIGLSKNFIKHKKKTAPSEQ